LHGVAVQVRVLVLVEPVRGAPQMSGEFGRVVFRLKNWFDYHVRVRTRFCNE
jgi:hypothetical protein